jgi:NADP-dependent 3-hydroxy acid dehydrogenase YdfG
VNLDGKVCLITVASAGIGAAPAKAIVEHGAWVALLARSRPDLELVASS